MEPNEHSPFEREWTKEEKEQFYKVKEKEVEKKKLTDLRNELIRLRMDCMSPSSLFDADGLVILSHAIRWLYFKIEDKPYEPPTD